MFTGVQINSSSKEFGVDVFTNHKKITLNDISYETMLLVLTWYLYMEFNVYEPLFSKLKKKSIPSGKIIMFGLLLQDCSNNLFQTSACLKETLRGTVPSVEATIACFC